MSKPPGQDHSLDKNGVSSEETQVGARIVGRFA